MLTESGCQQRQANLWAHIPDDIDWLLIGDARHVEYLSGFRINPLSFSADQKSLLLMQRNGRTTLVADNFSRRSAVADPCVSEEVIQPWYNHRNAVKDRPESLLDGLAECRHLWQSGRGIVESHGVSQAVAAAVGDHAEASFADAQTGQTVNCGHVIRQLRRQKLEDEVALLELCMAACDAGHKAAFAAAKPGASELDVYLAVSQAAQQQAGCACAVYGDFRATNAEVPKAGGLPTNYRLREGDLFIVDYSVIIGGYRSDFTNTIAVGQSSEAQVRQFEVCRDALLAAESILKPGITGREVHAAASAVMQKNGYPAMAHHAGHGLGLEHPEPPILVPESDDTLLVGDVITLEPGLYIEGVGGMRFEHNYLITESGARRLSQHHIGLTE